MLGKAMIFCWKFSRSLGASSRILDLCPVRILRCRLMRVFVRPEEGRKPTSGQGESELCDQSGCTGRAIPCASCGVLPAGLAQRQGANNGAHGFSISTPESGVDSLPSPTRFLILCMTVPDQWQRSPLRLCGHRRNMLGPEKEEKQSS